MSDEAPRAQAGWYPTPDGQRYWDGERWAAPPAAVDETVTLPPARRRMSRGALLGIALGTAAAVVVVGIVAAVAISAAVSAAASKPFAEALEDCGLNPGTNISLLDDGDGLLLDGQGEENAAGLTTEKMACVLVALDVPETTLTRMDSTRSLDGRQKDELDDYTVEWTYHPDDGLDVLFTR